MKLLVVRHGDPDYSIDSLTPVGWTEAELLSQRLKKLDVKAFYCSPLGRAKDTAAPTLKALGREAEILPWLQEFVPADVVRPDAEGPGVPWDWVPQDWVNYPDFYDKDRWMSHPVFQRSGIQEAVKQVYEALDALLARHGYVREGSLYRAESANEDTVVLFCHFGLECLLLSRLLNISPMLLWHGTCAAPSSVTTLTTEERKKGVAVFRMNAFADISHLYAADQAPSFAARFCETWENFDQRHD